MGSSSNKQENPDLIAHFSLLRSHYLKNVSFKHTINRLKIHRMYRNNNFDVKDYKEIAVFKRTSLTNLTQAKSLRQSFNDKEISAISLSQDTEAIDLTDFFITSKQTEGSLSDQIFNTLDQIESLSQRLQTIALKKQQLKKRFLKNQELLKNQLIEKRKIVHKKTILSADTSISINISNLDYNFLEDGQLTERSLNRALGLIKNVPKPTRAQSILMSKLTIKTEMKNNYELAKNTLDKRLEKSRKTIQILEQELNQPPADDLLSALAQKAKSLESEIQHYRSQLPSRSKHLVSHQKELDLLEERASRPISFLL